MPAPKNPLPPFTRGPQIQQLQPISTDPKVISLTPNSGRTGGGDSVVIAGKRFKSAPDGTLPTVTFGGVAATVTAVAADGTSITVTTPASANVGYVDIVVTNPQPNQSVTFAGGFLYYAGTITSVTPAYANTSGGVQVTIKGVSLQVGATFTFGGVAATSVTHIDDTQYVVTVPSNAAGYVDVVMTETGGHTSTIRNGFQYTTLARGTDIRRSPGIQISKALGNGSWTAKFSLDGQTNKPVSGEEIQITDAFDSGRVLFHGQIQMADQNYEGQTNQLRWDCTGGDFQYMLNKYRPFGSYTAVNADLVVRDLMSKYTSDFDLTFVQTNLAPVTLTFDGTKTMSESLDIIARAIGGGRWYLDARQLHFFNPPAPTTIVVPAGSTGTGADFTAAVLSLGSALGTTQTYTQAYYAIRVSFLYSNGTESRLGPTSNVIPSDGQHYLTATSLPIGLNPSGSITVVGRRIYYLQGTNDVALAAEIDDNSTTTFSFAPLTTVPPTVGTNLVGSVSTQTSTGATSGTATQATAFKPTFSADPFYYIGTDLGPIFEFGGTPQFTIVSTQAQLRGGQCIQLVPPTAAANSYAYWVKFAITLTYPDGSTTQMSDPAGNSTNPFGGLFFGNVTAFSPGQAAQWTCFYYPGVVSAPLVNGQEPVYINLFMQVVGSRNYSAGGGGGGGANDVAVANPIWQQVGNVPYYDGTNANGATSGGNQLSSQVVAQSTTDFGQQPAQVPGQVQLTYVWPNPDGPYLEDYRNPSDITDTNPYLLHGGDDDESGSQPFMSTEDITQLRNRVKVYGASSVTVLDANAGDNAIAIANPAIFPIGGGTVVAANGVQISFFSVSSQITSTNTPAKLLLTAPLTAAIPNGTTISFYCMAEDKGSQTKRGQIELDSHGNPTDGVHEYVVIDQSLDTTQSVYLRANAELAIFKDPIITIKYATREPTFPGSRVNVNLTDPPCIGTFLIQDVEIDQVRDDGDQLAPRYTVTATSVFYDLTNFLLLLTAGSQVAGAGSQSSVSGGSNSSVGVLNSAAQQALSSSSSSVSISGIRGVVAYSSAILGSTTPIAILASTQSWTGNNSTTVVSDNRASWLRLTSTAVGNANSVSMSALSFRLVENPMYKCYFRIPTTSSILNQRWWIGFKQSASPIFPNADSITGGGPGIGVRFSTTANDASFRLFTSDNVTQTMGDTLSKISIVAGYEYDMTIQVIGGGAAFTVTMSSYLSSTGALVATDNRTLAIPQGAINTTLAFAHFQYQTINGITVAMDMLRVYLQSGLLL